MVLLASMLAISCAVEDVFKNSTKGEFFNVSYPDIFIASYNGIELKLTGPYEIVFKSYLFDDDLGEKEIQSSIDSLSKVIGGKPSVKPFPLKNIECRKISYSVGAEKKIAYVFWTGKWVGTARLSKAINEVQESLVDRIMDSLAKGEGIYSLQNNVYQSAFYEIQIPDGWSGKVVNHFSLSMTKNLIADGAGLFDVSVIRDTKTKDSLSWAQSYAKIAGWTLKAGNIKINGVKFTTFKNTKGSITTRIYCCCQNGMIAVMAYSVTSPAIEKQAMDIAKGFRFR